MKSFQYSGYNASGARTSGTIQAPSTKEALRTLAQQQIYAELIQPTRSTHSHPPTEAQRATLYRELSALLQAGLPLDQSLQLLIGENNSTPHILTPILEAICEGAAFSQAIAAAIPNLSQYELAMLQAAEQTGALPDMLARIASFQEARRAMTEKLRSATANPTFVLILGILVAFLMLGVLVPLAQRSLASSGIALPKLSLIIVSSARILATTAGTLLLLATLTTLTLIHHCKKSPSIRTKIAQYTLKLPIWGKPLQALASQRFAETLSALIRAGVPLVDAFSLAGASTGNAWIHHLATQQATQIRNGSRTSQAITNIPPIHPYLSEWIRVGEAGGCLEAMLDVASSRALAIWNHACDHLLALIGPIVLVSVGIFVLAVALAVLLPVTAMTLTVG